MSNLISGAPLCVATLWPKGDTCWDSMSVCLCLLAGADVATGITDLNHFNWHSVFDSSSKLQNPFRIIAVSSVLQNMVDKLVLYMVQSFILIAFVNLKTWKELECSTYLYICLNFECWRISPVVLSVKISYSCLTSSRILKNEVEGMNWRSSSLCRFQHFSGVRWLINNQRWSNTSNITFTF